MKRKTALARCTILLITCFSISLLSFSQKQPPATTSPIKVSGRVVDENGKPMVGVNVLVKSTPSGTTTDADGNFAINVPSGKSVLVFSFIGYEEQEVILNNRNEISVSMKLASNSLSDVVVIGYGSQKKKNVTGAVSKLKNENFDERPINRVDQALVGQLAGVTVKQNTGI